MPRDGLRAESSLTQPVVPRGTWSIAVVASLLTLPLLVLAAYSRVWLGHGEPSEMAFFGPAGAAILQGRWGAVFADPVVQGGPLELLPYGVLELIAPDSALGWVVIYTVLGLLVMVGYLVSVVAPWTATSRRTATYLAAGAGAAVCLSQDLWWSVQVGHPAQVAIPALWLLAALAVRRGHAATAGVLVALSAGWEPWGVLGAPVVFCAPRPRLLRAGVAGSATLAVLYGPFVAAGDFRLFDHVWPVMGTSMISTLFPGATEFSWSLRLLQAAFALGVGVAVAVVSRRTIHGLWLAPLSVVTARLALDPLTFAYYWIAPQVLLVAWAASALTRRLAPALLVTAIAAAYSMSALRTPLGAVLLLALTVSATLLARRAEGGPSGTPPAPQLPHDTDVPPGPPDARRSGRHDALGAWSPRAS